MPIIDMEGSRIKELLGNNSSIRYWYEVIRIPNSNLIAIVILN